VKGMCLVRMFRENLESNQRFEVFHCFVFCWGIVAIGWSFVVACSSSIVGCCLKLQKFSTLHHGC
jgi:hypothetical protein